MLKPLTSLLQLFFGCRISPEDTLNLRVIDLRLPEHLKHSALNPGQSASELTRAFIEIIAQTDSEHKTAIERVLGRGSEQRVAFNVVPGEK